MTTPHEALRQALSAQLRLRPATDLEALFERRRGSWMARPAGRRFRFDGHLDLAADAIVYLPPPRGVVGLVQVLPADPSLIETARRAVHDAVQVRQLLLAAAEATDGSAQVARALQVELVLVLPHALGSEQRRAVAQAFNDIARHTHYIRLVGLNLLQPGSDGRCERSAVRRAFCWVMHDTAAWLKEIGRPDPTVAVPAWTLTTRHYRVPGERRFDFAGGARLHLVHGHNGSGKSTLVEALELLLTHRIERLDQVGETRYADAIVHRPPGRHGAARGHASATLSIGRGPLASCTVGAHGTVHRPDAEPPLAHVRSFRIDQSFMNDLVRADPAGRARLFLETFAPDDTPRLAALRAAEAAFRQASAALPPALQPATPPTELAGQLAWTASHLAPLAAGDMAGPLRRSLLLPPGAGAYAALSTDWAALVKQLEGAPAAALPSLLGRVDEEMQRHRDSMATMAVDMDRAFWLLVEVGGWVAAGRVHRGISFEQDLQRWLELQALVDLSRKYREVVETLALASENGWTSSLVDDRALPPERVSKARVEQLRLRGDELQQELNDARERLRDWQGGPAARGSATPPSARRHRLTEVEQQLLDRVGAWLPAAAAPLPLGQLINQALQTDQARTMAGGVIGSPGGLARPIAEAKALNEQAMTAVPLLKEREPPSAARTFQQVVAVVDAARALDLARDELATTFYQRLVGTDGDARTQTLLDAAINELLACMTPARWEYGDIRLRLAAGSETPTLGFAAHGDARADLTLNTAELTAFCLVLFLLLAPRLPHPLRLLVLDDPLQNMDEMMVCTLARALASLLPLLPPGWSVLAFFHGMDDMERIRDETPAMVYHLPWARTLAAAPGQAAASASTISALPARSTHERDAQVLDTALLGLAPA